VVARADEQAQLRVQEAVRLAYGALVVVCLLPTAEHTHTQTRRGALTKNSAVRPDGSLTPPPNMVLDVLLTWGVPWREPAPDAPPPLRTAVPRSQPPTAGRDMR
jgi:hypothetical protein